MCKILLQLQSVQYQIIRDSTKGHKLTARSLLATEEGPCGCKLGNFCSKYLSSAATSTNGKGRPWQNESMSTPVRRYLDTFIINTFITNPSGPKQFFCCTHHRITMQQ
ncbi:unnamed protein product [Ixodes pacificus]